MLPLMLILIFVGLEAGHYLFTEHKVIKAVREGSRYAGRLPFNTYDCSSDSVDSTADQNIRNVTRTGTPSGSVPLVPGWADSGVTVTVSCDATTTTGIFQGNAGGAPRVTVSAQTSYPSLFNGYAVIGNSAVIAASSQAVVNGI